MQLVKESVDREAELPNLSRHSLETRRKYQLKGHTKRVLQLSTYNATFSHTHTKKREKFTSSEN